MSPLWQLFRATVLKRPGILAILLLFYLVGLFVAAGSVSDQLWLGLAVLFAFPTAGIAGVVTERAIVLCQSAGELAIPRHPELVRRFQLLTLSIVAVPVGVAAALGENVLAVAAILCGAAVLGAWLASRPYMIVIVVVAAVLLRDHSDWLENAYVQATVLALELYALVLWLRLPFDVEAAAGVRVSTFADARHEHDAEPPPETDEPDQEQGVEPARVASYEAALEQAVARHGYRAGFRATREDLGFAVGFDASHHVRAKLVWTGIACLVVLATYFIRGQSSVVTAYGVVMFVAIASAFGRASSLYDAWRHSRGEQSLLRLAPFWPDAEMLKPALVRAAVASLLGAWAVWVAATPLALALGALHPADAVTSAAVMVAVSTGIVGNLLVLLSRPKQTNWRLITVFTYGAPAIGALAIAFRNLGTPVYTALALLVVPALVGAALFWRRPLPFPV